MIAGSPSRFSNTGWISPLVLGTAALLLAACFDRPSDEAPEGEAVGPAVVDTSAPAPAGPIVPAADLDMPDSAASSGVPVDSAGGPAQDERGVELADPDTIAAGDSLDSAAGDSLDGELDSLAFVAGVPLLPVTQPEVRPTATPPAAAQEIPSDLTQRLDRIVASQEALASRLDSLATSGAAAAGGGPSADAGQVLGQAREEVRSFGLGVVWALLVLILFNYTIRTLVWVLDQLAESSVTRRLFYKKLVPITRILLWVFAAYLIVRVIFQVDAQGFLAAAAAVGVAIGFAAQDLLKNLFGGIILVFDQPFQVGDKISAGGTYGEVVSIGLRSTRIVTPDDNLVSVPNAQVVDGQVANANAGELNCQVVTNLYLPGWIDEAQAKKIAFEAAASSKYVYLNKPIVVLVKDEFKETFLTHLKVKAYVLDPRYEFLFESDVTERARAGFRDAGLLEPSHGLRAYLDMSQLHPPPGSVAGREGPGHG
jgi:small-conductance mechanosensitive channel